MIFLVLGLHPYKLKTIESASETLHRQSGDRFSGCYSQKKFLQNKLKNTLSDIKARKNLSSSPIEKLKINFVRKFL